MPGRLLCSLGFHKWGPWTIRGFAIKTRDCVRRGCQAFESDLA